MRRLGQPGGITKNDCAKLYANGMLYCVSR
ncbi:hypothetical protein FGB62_350g06, partial [Gracilaria domingensis]